MRKKELQFIEHKRRREKKIVQRKDNFFLEQYLFFEQNKTFSSHLVLCMKQRYIVTYLCVYHFSRIFQQQRIWSFSQCVWFKFQQWVKKSIFHGLLRSICIFIHTESITMNKKNILVKKTLGEIDKTQSKKQYASKKNEEIGFLKWFVLICCCCVRTDCTHLWHTINKDKISEILFP